MGLTQIAQAHAQRFLNNIGHFGVAVNLTTPDGSLSIDLKGFHVKHNTGFNTDGIRVNTKTASVAITELDLIAFEYPYRPGDEVVLQDHTVLCADASGNIKSYIVRENYPDEKLGYIILILGDYEQ